MSQPKLVLKPNNRSISFDLERLQSYIARIMANYPHLNQDKLTRSVLTKIREDEVMAADITKAIYMSAVEMISLEEPDWQMVAAHAFLTKIYKEAALNRGYKSYVDKPYGSFYNLIKTLTDKGLYNPKLMQAYTKEEIEELGHCIEPKNDLLFNYIGLVTLNERYLTSDFEKNTYELPQERFMIISMIEMMNEPHNKRLHLVKEAYWAQSNLYMTVATPTLSNAGKARGGQLSSCFIDTVEDSLKEIYNANTDAAMLSKMGGGIGVYAGKIRARGSDIRGYKGKSSGVVPWIRQLNNTAVNVDQLGTRGGAIAVYLDVWHKDILAFLDLRLNNGDERMRAHDIFTGICIPDLFMEAVEARADWHLFDPHEVRQLMGYSLEDFYDEEVGKGSFREKYEECVNHPLLSRVTVPAIDIMKRAMKSQLETGTPYMFYRDTVNRANPNKAHGIIYCSNLCTEITQNMSPTTVISEQLVDENGETIIVVKKKPGDFVVCNLASINLGRAYTAGVLERLITIMIRMLDNVIDINNIEVLQAQRTNKLYRAIGLGTFGFHHLLALLGIMWESDKAVEFTDQLYEDIAYYAIKASNELAREKGAYKKFKGSEWDNGNYFVDRGYVRRDPDGNFIPVEGKERWYHLALLVKKWGMRNGWLMAVAPNGSTSLIGNSTASIDPVYELITYTEKTTYKIATPVPDLNIKTLQYYRKNAFNLDQHASIRLAAVRQKHIDQSQSFNLYVRPDIKASALLALHMDAWKSGLKTTYYLKSRALEIEECESCAS